MFPGLTSEMTSCWTMTARRTSTSNGFCSPRTIDSVTVLSWGRGPVARLVDRQPVERRPVDAHDRVVRAQPGRLGRRALQRRVITSWHSGPSGEHDSSLPPVVSRPDLRADALELARDATQRALVVLRA